MFARIKLNLNTEFLLRLRHQRHQDVWLRLRRHSRRPQLGDWKHAGQGQDMRQVGRPRHGGRRHRRKDRLQQEVPLRHTVPLRPVRVHPDDHQRGVSDQQGLQARLHSDRDELLRLQQTNMPIDFV